MDKVGPDYSPAADIQQVSLTQSVYATTPAKSRSDYSCQAQSPKHSIDTYSV